MGNKLKTVKKTYADFKELLETRKRIGYNNYVN